MAINKREAKLAGIDAGADAARFNFEDAVKEYGQAVGWTNPESDVTVFDREALKHLEDKIVEAALEGEQNARQYSPFEFFANEMNADEDRSDELWQAYDDGVSQGAAHMAKRLLKGQLVTSHKFVALKTKGAGR